MTRRLMVLGALLLALSGCSHHAKAYHPGEGVSDNEKCLEDVLSTIMHRGEESGDANHYPGGMDNPVYQLALQMTGGALGRGTATHDDIKRACEEAGNPNNSAYGWTY